MDSPALKPLSATIKALPTTTINIYCVFDGYYYLGRDIYMYNMLFQTL